jgi:tellurite resistance protein
MLGSEKLVNIEDIIKEVQKFNPSIKSLRDIRTTTDIESLNKAARGYIDSNTGFAGLQGAATGAMGLAALPVNIPALFSVIFRMMQQIALIYGFDPNDPAEKDFMLKILALTATSSKKEKKRDVNEIEISGQYLKSQLSKIGTAVAIKQANVQLLKQTWKSMGSKSALITIKSMLKTLGINLTKKKALQMVPVVSSIIGAAFDSMYTKEVGEVCNMLYRQRRIDLETYEILTIDYSNAEYLLELKEESPVDENPFAEDNPFGVNLLDPLSDDTKYIASFLVKIGLADGEFDDDEREYVINTVKSLGESISDDDMTEIASIAQDLSVDDILSKLTFNDELEKDNIILLGMVVSMIDGDVHSKEIEVIQKAASALDISKEKFNEIYKEASRLIKEIKQS